VRASLVLLALGLALAPPSAAWAVDPVYTGRFSSTALGGYDAVAYFSEGKPVEGSAEFEYAWKGATWRFASAEHRDRFAADPEAYTPQYGGYCAYAVANGGTAPGDPQVWRIVDGKLYLNVNESVAERWSKDIPGYVAKADAAWPKLLAE